MADYTEVRAALDRAVYVLAELPPERWDEWLVLLLKELDENARASGHRDVYAGMLDSIRRDITSRLDLGRW
jgi:hypothetical protein